MSKLTLDGFLVCMVVCAACTSDSTSSGTPTDPFIGKWGCSEERTVTFTSPSGRDPQTTTERSTVTISAAGNVLTASKEVEGGSGCQVSFVSNGSGTGTLVEGQTCTTTDGITIAYKSGSATVSGSSMNSTYSFDATANIVVGGMMVTAMATGTQNSTCSRLTPPPSGGGTTGGW